MGVALEEMNNAMCTVNDLEASVTQAKRKAGFVEAEQKQRCQVRRFAGSVCPAAIASVSQRSHRRQAAFDKLSRGVKEALPVCRRQVSPLGSLRHLSRSYGRLSMCIAHACHARPLQILARQQLEKTRLAFVEYQRAHDAHAEAKAAAAAVESQLMASSGALGVHAAAASCGADTACVTQAVPSSTPSC